jgi:hypothetical protein
VQLLRGFHKRIVQNDQVLFSRSPTNSYAVWAGELEMPLVRLMAEHHVVEVSMIFGRAENLKTWSGAVEGKESGYAVA